VVVRVVDHIPRDLVQSTLAVDEAEVAPDDAEIRLCGTYFYLVNTIETV